MVKEIKGDLLKAGTYYIAHQVNCRGKMGAGVAYQIRRHVLGERGYNDYRAVCRNKSPEKLLGTNQYYPVKGGQVVVNMFGEDIPTGPENDTDYEALQKCLENLKHSMEREHRDASIPGYIGCGLADGCWDYVYTSIILPIFKDSNQTLYTFTGMTAFSSSGTSSRMSPVPGEGQSRKAGTALKSSPIPFLSGNGSRRRLT